MAGGTAGLAPAAADFTAAVIDSLERAVPVQCRKLAGKACPKNHPMLQSKTECAGQWSRLAWVKSV